MCQPPESTHTHTHTHTEQASQSPTFMSSCTMAARRLMGSRREMMGITAGAGPCEPMLMQLNRCVLLCSTGLPLGRIRFQLVSL